MRDRIFVSTTDVNYASSKTSATVNTALNPYDLAVGAIGLYGIHRSGSTNLDKLVLITDGGSEAAGTVSAASFTGTSFQIAIGKSTGADLSGDIDVANLKMYSKVYVPPVLGVQSLGYNASFTSNSLNLPTLVNNDEAILRVISTSNVDRLNMTGVTYSGYARTDSPDTYDVLKGIVDASLADENALVKVDISGNGTVTESAQNVTVTNGSATVTFAGNVTVATGAKFFVRDSIYKVAVGVTTGTTITLDRVYVGATETIVVASTTDVVGTVASTTSYGLIVTELTADNPVALAVSGVVTDADKAEVTAHVASSGSALKVQLEEENARPRYGNLDNLDRRVPLLGLSTDLTLTYDQYELIASNVRGSSDPHNGHGNSTNIINVGLAFPSTIADTGGKNQSNFEDIMASLGVTVSTLF